MRLASEGSERSEIVPGGLKKDSLANHPGEETKRVIAEGAPFNLLLPDRDPLSTFSIAVDTGSEGVALPSTRLDAEGRTTVLKSLGKLEAGGSTNGGGGIKLAYELAMKEKNRGRSEPRAARHRR